MDIGDHRPDFDDPLGLMESCHRRVERFLGILLRVARGPTTLDPERRRGLEAALAYFRESGPLHTEDEEQSLHPRLRDAQPSDPEGLLARIEALELDHREAEPLHEVIESLGQDWLEAGSLSNQDQRRLCTALDALAALYPEHIRFEDEVLYPWAATVLSDSAVASMGVELAVRRGVDLESRPSF